MSEQVDHLLLRARIARYSADILGLCGWIFDTGELQLYCGNQYETLMLPAPAASWLEDIYARRAARATGG